MKITEVMFTLTQLMTREVCNVLPHVGVTLDGILGWRLDLLTTLTHDS
jgi:hypothetical protein